MNFQSSFFVFLKGFLMGVADVIPGVSGGTIAFITGIYQKLLSNINLINLEFIKLFFTRPLQAIKRVDLLFLVLVFSGILTSVKTLAGVVTYSLENHPILTWSLFNGLILSSSVIIIAKEFLKEKTLIKQKKIILLLLFFLVGIFLGYMISSLSSLGSSSNSFLSIFFSGFIAISAMILPGISGSFLLIILGKYEIIMLGIKNLDVRILLPFAIGCLSGILLMAKVVFFLLKRYYSITLFFLIGLMLGCLKKIYPWKIDQKNVLPQFFESINGDGSSHLFLAIVFGFLGILISVALFKMEKNKN